MASLDKFAGKLLLMKWTENNLCPSPHPLAALKLLMSSRNLLYAASCPSPFSQHSVPIVSTVCHREQEMLFFKGCFAAGVAVSHLMWLFQYSYISLGDSPLLKIILKGCLQTFYCLGSVDVWMAGTLNAAGSISGGRSSEVWPPSWKHLTNNLASA